MMRKFITRMSVPAGMLAVSGLASAASPTTALVSVGTDGVLPECGNANAPCYSVDTSITPDARYVAFRSVAHNIVPGPAPAGAIPQILVHDRHECTTIRISESPSGQPANFACSDPTMSADGQFVTFRSSAGNLVPEAPQGTDQVYIYDRKTQSLELITRSPGGTPGNGNSAVPQMSDDGRYVVFQSAASNLVSNDSNSDPDIFIYDRETELITRINVNEAGQQANGPSRRPAMSPNGRYIAFDSSASNLVRTPFSGNQVFLLDRDSDENGTFDEPGGTQLTLVSVNDAGEPANGFASWGVPSPNGQRVVFSGANTVDNLVPDDTNGKTDVFMRDLAAQKTTRESVGPNGEQTTAGSYFPFDFSADSRYLTFHSGAQELIEGGHNGVTHIIRRDLKNGENLIISRNSDGVLADLSSEQAVITSTGQTVAFASAAMNLEPGFENHGWVNVYVRSLQPSDLDNDGGVNVADLLMLLNDWGAGGCSIADINDDGNVTVADLLELLSSWGA